MVGKNNTNNEKNNDVVAVNNNSNYMTLDMVQGLLSVQRDTIFGFFNDLNKRIDSIYKDVSYLKNSLSFTGDVCDEKIKKVCDEMDGVKAEIKSMKSESEHIKVLPK